MSTLKAEEFMVIAIDYDGIVSGALGLTGYICCTCLDLLTICQSELNTIGGRVGAKESYVRNLGWKCTFLAICID